MTTPRTRTRKKATLAEISVEPSSEVSVEPSSEVSVEPSSEAPTTKRRGRKQATDDTAIATDPLKNWVNPELIPKETAVKREWIVINLIPTELGTQSRSTTSQATIDEYATTMIDGLWQWEHDPLPKLFWDGERYHPGDGHHRIKAAVKAKVSAIFCEVQIGSLRDAIFHSLSANRFHGLQRTNSDKRNQVEIALKDTEWQTMSDRAIAEHCGVSAPFVGKLRADLVEQGAVTVSSERTDKRGRKLKTDNIGTKAKPEKGRRADGSIDRRSSAATSSAHGGSGDQRIPEVHGNSSGEFVTFKPAASLKECLAALAAEYGGMEVLALAVLEQCSQTELGAVLEKARGE